MRAAPMLLLCLGASSALLMKPIVTPRASLKMMGWRAQPNPDMWYIFPRDVGGMLTRDHSVPLGQEQVLGRYDMTDTGNLRPDQAGISPEQCAVQVAQDGSHATLFALGQTPTGFRQGPQFEWQWLQPGQSQVMQHHWKISMDYNYPDQAVYKLADGYV